MAKEISQMGYKELEMNGSLRLPNRIVFQSSYPLRDLIKAVVLNVFVCAGETAHVDAPSLKTRREVPG